MFKRAFTFSLVLLLTAGLFVGCEMNDLESLDAEPVEQEFNFEIDENGRFTPLGGSSFNPAAPPPPPGNPRRLPRTLSRCYDLVFPLTVSLADSTTVTANDFDELSRLIREWLTSNPDPEQRPGIVFPFAVELDNGTLVTIGNVRELGALLVRCFADGTRRQFRRHHRGDRFDCYELVFPVTVGFPDESTAIVDSTLALRDTLRAWKEANPDAEERPGLVFPYDVVLEDGSTITITSEEDLEEVRMGCYARDRHPRRPDNNDMEDNDCYNLVFPVAIDFPDGTSVEYADREELAAALAEWRTANPDATERPELALPYSVELMDGTLVSIEDQSDINRLRSRCRGSRGNIGNRCFQVVYPLTVVLPDESSVEVNSREELYDVYRNWLIDNPESRQRPRIELPYSVEFTDGTVVTIESRRDLLEAAWSCYRGRRRGHNRPFFNRNICYELVYPVMIAFPDGTTQEVADREERRNAMEAWWEANPEQEEDPTLVFPFDIRLRNGETVTIDDQDELARYRRRCRR